MVVVLCRSVRMLRLSCLSVHLDRLGSERWSKDDSEARGVDDESGRGCCLGLQRINLHLLTVVLQGRNYIPRSILHCQANAFQTPFIVDVG